MGRGQVREEGFTVLHHEENKRKEELLLFFYSPFFRRPGSPFCLPPLTPDGRTQISQIRGKKNEGEAEENQNRPW